MKTTIFSLLVLLCTTHVQSDFNFDYFVMNEAHILERRANEDANAGYPPFYMECPLTETRNSCFPVIPIMNDNEGYVTTKVRYNGSHIYYGCLKKRPSSNEFNPKHYKKTLTMKRAKATTHPNNANFEPYFNLYDQICASEVSPVMWKIRQETVSSLQYYGIGFMIDGHDDMPLAEVYFDNDKKIPLWTKHTLYKRSLAAPTATFTTLEELVYENSDLRTTIQYYYKFNDADSETRSSLDRLLIEKRLNTIPKESKISLAHLIPEYDMILNSWKKVACFPHTIAPMWTDLYVNEWAEVENKIRDAAFKRAKPLIVVSGTHGQLTFNYTPSEKNQNENIFFLNSSLTYPNVPVPEIFWKLVISEEISERWNTKKGIVIILRNLTVELERLNIFTPFQPPCDSKCDQLLWNGIEKPNLIYCCEVDEVKNIIDEFPNDVKNGNFEELLGG